MADEEARSFQDEVELQALPTGLPSLYPRPDLGNLYKFLKHSDHSNFSSRPGSRSSQGRDEKLISVYDLCTGRSQSFGGTSDQQALFASSALKDTPVLVFLRGYVNPRWLQEVAAKYGASAEFYRRHMEFEAFDMNQRDCFSSPGLPSSSSRVFQLTIPTLCSKSEAISAEPEDLREARQNGLAKMRAYCRDLRTKSRVADSIVRKYSPLDKSTDFLEQKVTVEVAHHGGTWRALVWLDHGRYLSEIPEGPWEPDPSAKWWETYYIPVIHHLRSETVSMTQDLDLEYPAQPRRKWNSEQNACVLPFQYGQHLDKSIAAKDAMYALSELLQFAATAQLQLLNKLQKLLEHEMSFVGLADDGRLRAISLLNLRHIKTYLSSHTSSLLETVKTLENSHFFDWPSVDEEEPTARKATAMVLANYRYLQERATSLSQETEQGMTTLANASILDESRRSTENARRIQKLTILATIFIPLSFVCTIWGMNFKEMGSGTKPIWWWPVTSVPVLALALLVYFLQHLQDLVTTQNKETSRKATPVR